MTRKEDRSTVPNLFDPKDARNLIIWLFLGLLALGTYIYQEDQQDLRNSDESVKADILKELASFRKDIKEDLGDMKSDYRDMKRKQETIAEDVAKIKAVSNIK